MILKTLFYEWQERKLPDLIQRDIVIDTAPQQQTKNATVITGFRRVGKTYLLFSAIKKLLATYSRENIVYINFEDERILPQTNLLTDLLPTIQALSGKKPTYLFLDELQLIPNWSKWVRRILDTEDIQLFITGSSSKMSSYELPTELRGRALEIQVSPLTFAEFLRFTQTTLDPKQLSYVPEQQARFQYLFREYLTFGALPAVVLTLPEKKQELLQSYFQTVVQLEIGERFQIGNDLALKTLLKLLINSSYITISKLHNIIKSMQIPIGKSTIDTYISYIESSYFMKQLFINNASVINQLQYPRKVYFIDTGFITALSTKFSANLGRLFENVVFQKLSHLYEHLHYYKDEHGNEVDFVVRDQENKTILYQACYDLADETTRDREIRSLIKAGNTLGSSELKIITADTRVVGELPQEIEVVTPERFLL